MNKLDPIQPTTVKSSIEHASAKQSRPKGLIDAPDKIAPCSPAFSVLRESIAYESNTTESLRLTGMEIEEGRKAISEIEKQTFEELKKKANDLQAANTWSALSDIASYISTVSNFLIGADYLTSGGTLTGSLLIASAGIGFSNQLMNSLGGWDWIASNLTTEENQKWLKDICYSIGNYLSSGAFLVSIGHSYTSGQFQHLSNQALQVIPCAAILSTQITTAASKYYEYSVNQTEMTLKELKNEQVQNLSHEMLAVAEIKQDSKEQKHCHEQARNIIEMTIKSQTRV